jgi:predicted MPP superfamily phosphohydrolase
LAGSLSAAAFALRIALVHSAEVADDADAAGYALYLCGHTHGGQICPPGGRPLVTPLKRCRHAASGLRREGRMVGYTSRGLTRGEVVVITLRRPTSPS